MKKIKKHLITMLLLIILLSHSFTVFATYDETSNEVSKRDLIMFASISYANLEEINNYILADTSMTDLSFKENNMVTDDQLRTIYSETNIGPLYLSDERENTYDYLFYNLASTNEVSDWKIVNYCKIPTLAIKGTAEFSAMTFKKGNDIVIAYRGTDFDDAGDWFEDLAYGAFGVSMQEIETQNYALEIAKQYPNSNIYLTGHSLGGYLTQIGTAALLNSEYKNNVKEATYFNGMGLLFWSNFENTTIGKATTSTLKLSLGEKNYYTIKDNSSKIQKEAKKTLENWVNNGGNLNLYNINGDIISSLGTHVGKRFGLDPEPSCLEHHKGNSDNKTNIYLVKTTFTTLERLFLNNTNASSCIEKYKPGGKNVLETALNYVWITHETDSFFGQLAPKMKIEFTMPSSIKLIGFSKITMTVNTGNAKLNSKALKTSSFGVSNNWNLRVVSVYNPTLTNVNGDNIYTYTILVNGLRNKTIANIYLKARALSTTSGQETEYNLETASPNCEIKYK